MTTNKASYSWTLLGLCFLGTTSGFFLQDDYQVFHNWLDDRRHDARRELEDAWSGDNPAVEEQSGGSCQTVRVLLTSNDTATYFQDGFSDYSEIAFGSIQGGTIPMSNPDNASDKIGHYTAFTTFLSPVNFTNFQVDCSGTGAYQFDVGEQITFSSPCSGLPFFTITGGQGSYFGAKGYVEYMLKDPAGRGFFHDIYVCSSSYVRRS